MTEEAKASGNALDRPTSVGSEMARKQAEPPYPGKANDDRRPSVGASRNCGPKEHSIERLPISIAKLSNLLWSRADGGPAYYKAALMRT